MTARRMQLVVALAVLAAVAAPAAADGFGFGISFSGGRSGTSVGLGFSWADRPAIVRPMVAQPVCVPTVRQAYRDVPVLDRWGRVVSYRREPVLVQSAQWATVAQPVAAGPWVGGSHAGSWQSGPSWSSQHDSYRPDNKWNPRYPASGGPRPMNSKRSGR